MIITYYSDRIEIENVCANEEIMAVKLPMNNICVWLYISPGASDDYSQANNALEMFLEIFESDVNDVIIFTNLWRLIDLETSFSTHFTVNFMLYRN